MRDTERRTGLLRAVGAVAPVAGFISDPRGKAKSVVFTESGLEQAKRLLEELFSPET